MEQSELQSGKPILHTLSGEKRRVTPLCYAVPEVTRLKYSCDHIQDWSCFSDCPTNKVEQVWKPIPDQMT